MCAKLVVFKMTRVLLLGNMRANVCRVITDGFKALDFTIEEIWSHDSRDLNLMLFHFLLIWLAGN